MADQIPQGSRVALIISSLGLGGAERQTLWLAEALTEIGHQVSIITWNSSVPGHYPLPAGVNRISLSQKSPAVSLPAKATSFVRRFLQVRNHLRDGAYDVALAMMWGSAVTTLMAGQGIPTRVVISERDVPWKQELHPTIGLLRRLTYRCADAQVAQTQPIADWLEVHTRSRNVRIVPNALRSPLPSAPPAVDPGDFRSAGQRLLLAAGTKPWTKGFDLLIDAFALIAIDFPEWDLAIVGLAPQQRERTLTTEDLVARASAHGLSTRVRFPGVAGNMADWYDAADIFVLSSRNEGFPNVLGEALAAGLPCVAFDCPTGPADLLGEGRDGVLVKDITSEALAEALAQTMSDTRLRERMSARAAIAAERYNPERVLALWCEVLNVAPRPQ